MYTVRNIVLEVNFNKNTVIVYIIFIVMLRNLIKKLHLLESVKNVRGLSPLKVKFHLLGGKPPDGFFKVSQELQ